MSTRVPVRVHSGDEVVTATAVLPSGVSSGVSQPTVLDALSLAARVVDEVVVQTARDTHLAVAERSFGIVNRTTMSSAMVPERIHRTLATGLYNSLSVALQSASAGLSKLADAGMGSSLEASKGGRALTSAFNGVIGDRLIDEAPRLAVRMSVRHQGADVAVKRESLAQAFPEATGRVVVFLHGLGENDESWNHNSYQMGGSYGSRLAAHASWTPVYLRLNTGLSVAENGVALTALLQNLSEQWPVEMSRLALVGHSMGGLIARAASAVATTGTNPWTRRLSDIVTLGTPHLGADLARVAKSGAGALGIMAESASFGRIIDLRSPGIRDLERGLPELPPQLDGVRYRLVSAELGSARSPLSWFFGDILVRRGSATGSGQGSANRLRRGLRLFPEADVLHIQNCGHIGLLNHPEVFTAMKSWLA